MILGAVLPILATVRCEGYPAKSPETVPASLQAQEPVRVRMLNPATALPVVPSPSSSLEVQIGVTAIRDERGEPKTSLAAVLPLPDRS